MCQLTSNPPCSKPKEELVIVLLFRKLQLVIALRVRICVTAVNEQMGFMRSSVGNMQSAP
jgi:hypothetical protein